MSGDILRFPQTEAVARMLVLAANEAVRLANGTKETPPAPDAMVIRGAILVLVGDDDKWSGMTVGLSPAQMHGVLTFAQRNIEGGASGFAVFPDEPKQSPIEGV